MNEIQQLLTLRDWLRWAVSRFQEADLFYGHGTDNAWDEALALILHALHLPQEVARDVLDARLTEEEREAVLTLLNRRIKDRVPVPYLTHEAWFTGLPFYVDERVLIPRSPLGELIENHFSPWLTEPPEQILDLCTGSGCIAIACAYAFPEAAVDASDLSEEALCIAKINVSRHHVEHQVSLIRSDLFDDLPQKKYGLIVSNPPYVDREDMQTLPAEYRHEPKGALQAGGDGLDIVMRILKNARDFLAPDGILIVETGNSEAALIKKLPQTPFTWLEFSRGGGGVFMLHAEQLTEIA